MMHSARPGRWERRALGEGAEPTDACDAVACGDQRIDRIMVRGGPELDLEELAREIPEGFVDARSGEPLSDHLPVAATIGYTR